MTASDICLNINVESDGGIIMADVFWLSWRCQKPVFKFSWNKWTFLAGFFYYLSLSLNSDFCFFLSCLPFFFLFYILTICELLFLVGWEKSQSCCELGTKSCLQLQLAPSGFVLPSYPLLFLIWSFRIFSEEPLARFLSTPSPGFQNWVLPFPLMCLQVTKPWSCSAVLKTWPHICVSFGAKCCTGAVWLSFSALSDLRGHCLQVQAVPTSGLQAVCKSGQPHLAWIWRMLEDL